MRIAILDMYNGAPNEGMRCLKTISGRFLAAPGVEGHYDVFDVRQHCEIPEIHQYDVFLSSGGPGNPVPAQLEKLERWERRWFNLIDQIWEHNRQPHTPKKYLFLICHSYQMAIHHWGLGKVGKRGSTSFGIFPMPLTYFGRTEKLFAGLPEPFYAVDSRDYQVVEPNIAALDRMGAKVLCVEKERPHVAHLERATMAIRFSREVFGTQFHPEADAEGMLRHFEKPEKRDGIIKNHGQQKYQDMVDSLHDPDRIMRTEGTLIPGFIEKAYNHLYVHKAAVLQLAN